MTSLLYCITFFFFFSLTPCFNELTIHTIHAKWTLKCWLEQQKGCNAFLHQNTFYNRWSKTVTFHFSFFCFPVLRLDNGEPLDLRYGGSGYYNPGLQGDDIQMTNIPSRRWNASRSKLQTLFKESVPFMVTTIGRNVEFCK